jgi:hypothetical protein
LSGRFFRPFEVFYHKVRVSARGKNAAFGANLGFLGKIAFFIFPSFVIIGNAMYRYTRCISVQHTNSIHHSQYLQMADVELDDPK